MIHSEALQIAAFLLAAVLIVPILMVFAIVATKAVDAYYDRSECRRGDRIRAAKAEWKALNRR